VTVHRRQAAQAQFVQLALQADVGVPVVGLRAWTRAGVPGREQGPDGGGQGPGQRRRCRHAGLQAQDAARCVDLVTGRCVGRQKGGAVRRRRWNMRVDHACIIPARWHCVHSAFPVFCRTDAMPLQIPPTKLPRVGTTIFTVMSQMAAEHGAVNLGQGFPDFPVPQRLVEELDAAMRAGHNQYSPVTGAAGLREAIAGKALRCYGAEVNPDTEITVTSGATEAIFNAIHAVVRPGEEVIVLDPAYDCYEPAIDLAGARAVHVPLDPATFAVDWDRVRAAITPRTRLLMINSPHNPSGAMFSADDMQALAAVLEGTDILLLSDEVYE